MSSSQYSSLLSTLVLALTFVLALVFVLVFALVFAFVFVPVVVLSFVLVLVFASSHCSTLVCLRALHRFSFHLFWILCFDFGIAPDSHGRVCGVASTRSVELRCRSVGFVRRPSARQVQPSAVVHHTVVFLFFPRIVCFFCFVVLVRKGCVLVST
jgi:hypothetical protein